MNRPLLAICIPTLFRPSPLSRLLTRLEEEFFSLSGEERNLVEFCVFVNGGRFSTLVNDATFRCPLKVDESEFAIPAMESFHSAVRLTTSEYIWLMGDDDFPLLNTIPSLLKVLGNPSNRELTMYQIQAGTDSSSYEEAYKLKSESSFEKICPGTSILTSNSFRWLGQMTSCIIKRNFFEEGSLYAKRQAEEIISIMRAVVEAACSGSIGRLIGSHYYRTPDASNWVGQMAFAQALEFPRYWSLATAKSSRRIGRPYPLTYICRLHLLCAIQRDIAPLLAQMVILEPSPSRLESILRKAIHAITPKPVRQTVLNLTGNKRKESAKIRLSSWDKEISKRNTRGNCSPE